MTEIEALVDAICSFSGPAWPHRGSADPEIGGPVGAETLEFVHWHIRSVQKALRFRMPGERGRRGRRAGADLTGLVEHWLVVPEPGRGYPHPIVESHPTNVAARARELIEAIFGGYFISLRDEPTKAYLVGLSTWLGCAGMAELLRPIYTSPENSIAARERAERETGYAWLKRCWEFEDARGNPWVRLGVESARLFKEARNEPVQDSWVPADSPYWRGNRAAPRTESAGSMRRVATPTH
jgi:hypothetical protein